MAKPYPIRLGRPLSYDDAGIHRHPDCVYEGRCCRKAAKRNWKGFSCLDCFFFRQYKREKLDEKK